MAHFIDCDAAPLASRNWSCSPRNWSVEDHIPGGQYEWEPKAISFYLSVKQRQDEGIEGVELRTELADKSVLNANVLDYLLAHPDLIPESWKWKSVFFWGTIYRTPDDILMVRCLFWCGQKWLW